MVMMIQNLFGIEPGGPAGKLVLMLQVFEDLDRVGLGGNLDVLAARAECCYEQVSLLEWGASVRSTSILIFHVDGCIRCKVRGWEMSSRQGLAFQLRK